MQYDTDNVCLYVTYVCKGKKEKNKCPGLKPGEIFKKKKEKKKKME